MIDIAVNNKCFGLLISCGLIYALVIIFCQALGQFYSYFSVGSEYSQNRPGFLSENITAILIESQNN